MTNILGLAPNLSQQQTPPTRGSELRCFYISEINYLCSHSLMIYFTLFYCLQGKAWHWGLQCECNFVGTFIKCWGELTGLTDFEQCLKDDLSEASSSWWCHSSSQVLSEMEDEVKFESDINSGFFWPWRFPNGSVIYTSLHKYTVKVVKICRSLFYFSLIQILWFIENVISTKLQVLYMSISRQIPNCYLENNWSFHLLSNLTCFWWANRPNII